MSTGIRATTERYLREHPEIECWGSSYGVRRLGQVSCCILGAALLAHGKGYFRARGEVDRDGVALETLIEVGQGASGSPTAVAACLGFDPINASTAATIFDTSYSSATSLIDFTYLLPE